MNKIEQAYVYSMNIAKYMTKRLQKSDVDATIFSYWFPDRPGAQLRTSYMYYYMYQTLKPDTLSTNNVWVEKLDFAAKCSMTDRREMCNVLCCIPL